MVNPGKRRWLRHAHDASNAVTMRAYGVGLTFPAAPGAGLASEQSLEKETPERRSVEPPESGRVVAVLQVGGLHHRYERRAA